MNKNGKCVIVSAFSCLGKTYLGNKYKDILDLEASHYKWIYNDKELAKDVEKRKGIKDRLLNPDYPDNYINAIIENIDKYKIILITPEKMIRNILVQKNLSYFIAYPTTPEFVKKRALQRGNNIAFALGLEKSYQKWYPDKLENVLWVKDNEYLENLIEMQKFIKTMK